MKKHEPKYIEVEGIMRACYDSFLKTGNKAYSDIIALADAVPAADVQEVRHGRWKNEIDTGTEMMACSVCGARVVKQPYIYAVGRKGYAYCPYCGAKMDEVEE